MNNYWRRFKEFLGPYDYNVYLIVGFININYITRLRGFLHTEPAKTNPLHFFLLGFLVIAFLDIPIFLILTLSKVIWKLRQKTLREHLIELALAIFIVNLSELVCVRFLIPALKIPNFLIANSFISNFLIRYFFITILIALTHSQARTLQNKLNLADGLIANLNTRYAALIGTDEEIRNQAAALLHDRIQGELLLAAARLTKTSQSLPLDFQAEITPVIKSLEKLRLTDIRQVSQLLTPNLAGEGLTGACETLCQNFSSVIDITIGISPVIETLHENQKLGIYRIIEQGVINSLKHGPAKHLAISVQRKSDTEIELLLDDDGPGANNSAPGKGSQIIDAWVAILGGIKEVETTPDVGYSLRVTLPG